MMINWTVTTLGNCVSKLGDGLHGTPIYSEDGDYYFINGNNLSDGRIIIKDDTKKVTEEEYYKYKKELNNRTILVSINGTLGNVGTYQNEKVILGKSACYFNVKEDIDKDFIKYTVSTTTFKYYSETFATGATIKNLSLAQIKKYRFNLPPLSTQQKIASILSTYDNLIQNYKKQIEDLQTCASELYKEWFVRFRFPGYKTTQFENGIPVGWKVERIGNVGEVIGGGTPSTEKDEYWDGDIPWLSPVDLSDNTNVYVSKGSKNITELGLKKSSTRMMPKDTVLLSSRAPVGYVALAKNPICTNQGFKNVVCDSSKIKPIYLYFYFKMNKNYLQSVASGATFPEISGSMMKKLKVLLPLIELQELFSNKAAVLINKAELLSEQITNLTQQRDLLLSRLMSGKLEVK